MSTSAIVVPTFEELIPTRDQVGERQFVCTLGHPHRWEDLKSWCRWCLRSLEKIEWVKRRELQRHRDRKEVIRLAQGYPWEVIIVIINVRGKSMDFQKGFLFCFLLRKGKEMEHWRTVQRAQTGANKSMWSWVGGCQGVWGSESLTDQAQCHMQALPIETVTGQHAHTQFCLQKPRLWRRAEQGETYIAFLVQVPGTCPSVSRLRAVRQFKPPNHNLHLHWAAITKEL